MNTPKTVIQTAGLTSTSQNWTNVAAAVISVGAEMAIVYPGELVAIGAARVRIHTKVPSCRSAQRRLHEPRRMANEAAGRGHEGADFARRVRNPGRYKSHNDIGQKSPRWAGNRDDLAGAQEEAGSLMTMSGYFPRKYYVKHEWGQHSRSCLQ